MKTQNGEGIVYGIDIDDIQQVALQLLERRLTDAELSSVKESVGDYIDWFQVVQNAIQKHIHE